MPSSTPPEQPSVLEVDFGDEPESFETAAPNKIRERLFPAPVPARANPGDARTLPHSREAEELLLSCILLDAADVLPRCVEAQIRADRFYETKHGIVFDCALDLHQRQAPVDISTVAEELKTSRQLDIIGGYAFLTQITSRSPTTIQAAYFIEKVREQALLRELIRSATGIVEDTYGFSGGIEDHLTQSRLRLESVTDSTSSTLAARKFDPSRPPPKERTIFSLAQIPLCTAGNLTNVTAQSGVGKTALVGAVIAAAFSAGDSTHDLLGFRGPNYDRLPLLHFDTEQSAAHYDANLRRALARAGLAQFPPWFHSYHLTGLGAAECRHAVEGRIAAHARKSEGRLFAVLIDGWADLVVSPNDERECFPFVTRMHELAIRHDCAIVGVLHLNPVAKAADPAKARGHLGSHLDRKAETVLQLEMVDGTTSLFSSKKRGAPIKKGVAAFKWSDEHQMHRSCVQAERPTGGRPKTYDFGDFISIFPQTKAAAMSRAQLFKLASDFSPIKDTAFRDVLAQAVQDGLLHRIPAKGLGFLYYLNLPGAD